MELRAGSSFKRTYKRCCRKHEDIVTSLAATLEQWAEDSSHQSLDLKTHNSYWKIRLIGKPGWRIMLKKHEDHYEMVDMGNHDIVRRY